MNAELLRLSDSHRPQILWFAGVAWDAVRGTDQQLAAAVSRHADVTYVDPPVPVHRPPRPGTRLRVVPLRQGLVRLTPRTFPGARRPGARNLTPMLLRAQVRRAVRAAPPDVVVSTSLDDVLNAVPGARRILVGTDDYVAGAALMDQPASRLQREERRQLRMADVVTAVTPTLAARWEAMSGRPVYSLPNGCDVDHYARVDSLVPPADINLSAPVAGLVGNISERIDMRLLEMLADAGISLLLVGPRRSSFAPRRFERLVSRPGVHWAGAQPYDALPRFLRAIDVGITPYVDDEFNRASYPLKTLEYLAAGRPAVSTALPAARALGTDLVTVVDRPTEFVAAVRAAAAAADDPRLVAARRRFAAQHSWAARAQQLLDLLDLPTSSVEAT